MARSFSSAFLVALIAAGCGGVDVVPSEDGAGGDGGAGSSTTPDTSSTGATPAGPGSSSTGQPATTSGEPATTTTTGPGSGGGGSSGTGGEGAGTAAGGSGGGEPIDPTTCEEAAQRRTNLGCDFWPTVTSNLVWEIFDYAVVVTNSGTSPANVEVERDGDGVDDAIVAAGAAHTFYLPWVDALKGPEADCQGAVTGSPTTARANGGAYRVTSDVPVAVYQFNPIEHSPDAGGPPGKDWSDCPANECGVVECLSYTNDASLVLPAASLGDRYRVVAFPSWELANVGGFLSIVATEDDTTVTVDLGALVAVSGGGGIDAIAANGIGTIDLDRGDVAQLIASVPGDFSGTLVTSNHPVQVMTGISCTFDPLGNSGCDHLEETILPAETLGSRYLVARPTGPGGAIADHAVRIVGDSNGTTLTYTGDAPPSAPETINAGQVIDFGVVTGDFGIQASAPIAIATFLMGAVASDPLGTVGDPSQSMPLAVTQFRRKYDFVAPIGWDETYLDVILPAGATAILDGSPLGGSRTALTAGFDIARVPVSGGGSGAHILEASEAVGVQVIGYGNYSSYQFPGGVSLP